MSSLERHRQADTELSPGRHQQDSHNKTLAERHSGEAAQIDTDQPIRQILEERHWVDPGRHQVILLDRLAEDIGKHFERDID